MSGAHGEGDVILGEQQGFHKPKGLLQALAGIQQYYIAERSGNAIPEDFLTTQGKLGFFSAGFKSGFVGGLISILLVPISIGVLGDYIPIFGSRNPGMFDKFFALLLSVSFSLGYAIFLATARKYYIGEITRVSIKNLLWGVTAGAFVKMMIAFILFHFIYLKVLQPETLSALLNRLQPLIKYDTLNYIYGWLMNFKPVFLTSAYFIVFVSLLYIAIPWTSVLFASRKIRRQIAQEEKWK